MGGCPSQFCRTDKPEYPPNRIYSKSIEWRSMIKGTEKGKTGTKARNARTKFGRQEFVTRKGQKGQRPRLSRCVHLGRPLCVVGDGTATRKVS